MAFFFLDARMAIYSCEGLRCAQWQAELPVNMLVGPLTVSHSWKYQPTKKKAHNGCRGRDAAGAKNLSFFIFYIIFFPIYQKYMPKLFFCKNVILPPVQPAEWSYRRMNRRPAAGALQKAYRRFIRRKGYCSDPRGNCTDLPPIETAVL